MILEFRIPQSHFLRRSKFEAGKSLNNQDLMFQSLKCLKQANHHGSYRYLTHIRQGSDKKERQDTKWPRIVCWWIWNRWQYWNLLLAKMNWYRDKIKGTVRPRNGIWHVTRSIFTKFVQGYFWWVRSRRISTRKIYRMTELVIKKQEVHWQFCQM